MESLSQAAPPDGFDACAVYRAKYNIMLAGSFDELSGKVIRIGHMGENARLEHMVPALEALSATLTDLGVTLQGNLADLFLKHYREFQD